VAVIAVFFPEKLDCLTDCELCDSFSFPSIGPKEEVSVFDQEFGEEKQISFGPTSFGVSVWQFLFLTTRLTTTKAISITTPQTHDDTGDCPTRERHSLVGGTTLLVLKWESTESETAKKIRNW
jgi:hypothetical protein